MTPSSLSIEVTKRLRGEILELVDEGHRRQESRLNDLVLWGVLQRMHYDVSQNDVLTVLQDLKERGYINCFEEKDRRTGSVRISQIQITPSGRDVLEGTKVDYAVHILR